MELYVLIVLFVLAGVCLHLNIINKDKRDFDTVIRVALVFLLVHTAVAFIGRTLPIQYWYVDWAAPFGLIYGPLLYIGYLSSTGEMPGKKKIRIHIFPFLAGLLCYIVYLFLPSEVRQPIRFVYGGILYAAMALSWFVYAVWGIYLVSRKKEMMNVAFKDLVSSVVIILFTLAAFVSIMVYTRTIKGIKSTAITSALLVYLGMLCGVVLIYQYTLRRFKEGLADMGDKPGSALLKEEVAEEQKLEYQKSSVKEEVMIAYSEKVDAFIESGAYLDMDLSLGKIATELKIPKHHLSQLFSQYYRQGFLEYINALRIRHACMILDDPKVNVNIADLAELCGFKSKPSFYRNFKNITGMTPTEFQAPLKELSS